jgi:hypothetical protein
VEDQSQIEPTDALDTDVSDTDEADLGDGAKKAGEGFVGKGVEL